MQALRRIFATLLVAIVVVLLLGGTTYVAQRYLPKPPEASKPKLPAPRVLDLEAVEKVLDLLQANYIHPIDETKLFAAGVKELRENLKSLKLDGKSVADIPAQAKDRKSLLAALAVSLKQAKAVAQDKSTEQKLLYVAMRGLLLGLDDPYCTIFEPAEYKHFEEQMSGGNFGGIGVYIELDKKHENRLTVVEPIEGTPAHTAGLKEGDFIAQIDGANTKGWDIEKAASKIRGPEGSTVMLSIVRGEEPAKEFPVKRAVIHVRSVTSKLLDGNIGYIRLKLFGEDTAQEFDQELQKLLAKGAKSLIIDLRNNGGGYVTAAIEICSEFVEKGKTIVAVVNARADRHDVHPSTGGKVEKMPMVVLVNRYSASASEITAGALHDHKLARLVGEKSFGKASVQQIEKLADGGALKYTVAHYLTPSGRDIHRRGIDVDLEVKVSNMDKTDKALEAAQETLKEQMKTK